MHLENRGLRWIFDGTILKHTYPKLGEPIPENVEMLRELQKDYYIVVFSARFIGRPDMMAKTAKYFDENEIPYDKMTYKKYPQFIAIIDDRAIGVRTNEPWPKDLRAQIESKVAFKASEPTIDELLKKTLSEDEIARLMDKLKNGTFTVKNLGLLFPEFVREADLGKKLVEDSKFNV